MAVHETAYAGWQYMKILIFACCYSWSPFSNKSRYHLKCPIEAVFLGACGHFNTHGVRDLSWHAAFAYLVQASPTVRLGSLLVQHLRMHRGIVLRVYKLTCTTLLQVALQGPLGQFPHVNDWQVVKTLTWPLWSLEDLLLWLLLLIMAAFLSVGIFVVTPQ